MASVAKRRGPQRKASAARRRRQGAADRRVSATVGRVARAAFGTDARRAAQSARDMAAIQDRLHQEDSEFGLTRGIKKSKGG